MKISYSLFQALKLRIRYVVVYSDLKPLRGDFPIYCFTVVPIRAGYGSKAMGHAELEGDSRPYYWDCNKL